ncbi:MAG: hypothetical protein U0326_20550 [Polyangiales bacterium]
MGSLLTLLVAWQRVVYERPPAGTLQRGLVALPRAPTVAVVLVAVVALLTWSLRARHRARRASNAPRHSPR